MQNWFEQAYREAAVYEQAAGSVAQRALAILERPTSWLIVAACVALLFVDWKKLHF